MDWKRPWIDTPPKDDSYICVYNDGGDKDDYLYVGIALYNEKEKCHNIHPEYLKIDSYMRFWAPLPEPPIMDRE